MIYRTALMSSCALMVATLTSPAQAQDEPIASAPADQTLLPEAAAPEGEIVVTARRREERLQDVPISVSAISGEALEQSGVSDVQGLQYRTPSLSITSAQSQRNTVAFALRGQRTQETQLFTDPPVGLYFAEIVQPRPYGFGNAFYDLQSVQVLKGVQGTLFGRNMTGGAVLVEPRRPELGVFGGEIRGQAGTHEMWDVTGAINVPIGENVAFRAAGRVRRREGWAEEVTTGLDYDNQHFNTFRVSALIDVGSFENLTVFDYYESDENGTASFMTALQLPSVISNYERLRGFGLIDTNVPAEFEAAQRLFARDRFSLDTGAGEGGNLDAFGDPFERIRNWGVSNRTTWDFTDNLTLKNIFGYREQEREIQQDYDGIPAFLITPNQSASTENVSEELQLQGRLFEDSLTFILGGYFFEESGRDGSLANTLPELNIVGAGLNPRTQSASLFLTANPGVGYSRTLAAFLAGTYEFTPEISLSAGIRYNYDKRRITVSPSQPNRGVCSFDIDAATPGVQTVPLDQCSFTNEVTFEEPTYDITLQYEPSDAVTMYASYRHGFRAGGFSTRATSFVTLAPFLPEFVDEYEIGLKTDMPLGTGRLRTSTSLFRQDASDVQKQRATFVNGNVFTVVDNTASQRNQGGEFEATFSSEHFSLTAFYSYVDVDILEGAAVSTIGLPEIHQRGTPKHQAGATAVITPPVDPDFGELNFILNYTWRSEIFLDDFELSGRQEPYSLINLRAELNDIGGSGLSAAVFVTNLLDETYRIGVLGLIAEGLGFSSSVYGEPRMVGGELSFRF